ncbi:hypothetical protein ACLMJK_009606 [Lecanora helva]
MRNCVLVFWWLLLSLSHVFLVAARDIAVITQTNISAKYLSDPSLDLPFTSILFISAGSNATEYPPTTVRIAHMQDDNSTSSSASGWGPPRVIVTQHQPNFTIPDLINAPSGIAWHVSHIGSLNDTLSQNLTAHDFMRTWGSGLIFDMWGIAAEEVAGSYVLGKADENVLCRVIIERLGLGNTEGAVKYSALVDQWQAKVTIKYQLPSDMTGKVQGRMMRMVTADTGEILDFQFKNSITIGPSPSTKPADEWVRTGVIEGEATVHSPGELYQGIYKKVFNTAMRGANTFIREALQPYDSFSSWQGCRPLSSVLKKASSQSGSSSDGSSGESSGESSGDSTTSDSAAWEKGTTIQDGSVDTPVSMVRQQGVMQTISLISEEAALAAGLTVVAVAVAFVVVDFVDGSYVGGSLGVIGILAGTLLPLFIEGPIGVLFGTVVALLFFMLPGFFGERKPELPSLNNTTEIIQYTFFGQKDHTGNEKCQQENSNCVASYGPGILSLTMDWEYFDAVVFLLEFNQGFPMTIPDIAAAFGNATSFDKDMSSDAVVQITCGNNPKSQIRTGRMGKPEWSFTDNYYCNSPSFHLNRYHINLPNINRTAAEVYGDIIGQPSGGGSCKIIDNADNPVTVPNYGITVQGLPVAIACGINATVPGENVISGSSTASESTNSNSPNTQATASTPASSAAPTGTGSHLTLPSGSSSGSLSTDGRDGEGYIPPPPPTPFANSLNPSNSACFTMTDFPNYFCLPNGTYDFQAGGTFNVYSSKTDGLYMAPGTAVNFRWQTWGRNWPIQHYESISWNISSPSDPNYNKNDNTLSKKFTKMSSPTFDILVPTNNVTVPPIACLFTNSHYGGDVTCVGVGGGNMTAGKGQVESVAIYGGASVTLYPNAYGDPGSQSFTVSVPDLDSVPYGTNSSLKDNVAAVLVLAHQVAIA